MRFLLFFLLICCGDVRAETSAEIEALWQKTAQSADNARWEDAKTGWDKLAVLLPDEPAVFQNRGMARVMILYGGEFDWNTRIPGAKTGALQPAIDDFSRALALDSQNADALFWRGMCLKAAGDARGARTDLDKAAQLDSEYQEYAIANRGTQFLRVILWAVMGAMVLLCLLGAKPFLRSLRQLNEAEKQARQ